MKEKTHIQFKRNTSVLHVFFFFLGGLLHVLVTKFESVCFWIGISHVDGGSGVLSVGFPPTLGCSCILSSSAE